MREHTTTIYDMPKHDKHSPQKEATPTKNIGALQHDSRSHQKKMALTKIKCTLSLKWLAALCVLNRVGAAAFNQSPPPPPPEFDKCERPSSTWAGFDQVNALRRSALLTLRAHPQMRPCMGADNSPVCVHLCRATERPTPTRRRITVGTSTLADMRAPHLVFPSESCVT